jgi:hypothetical protein
MTDTAVAGAATACAASAAAAAGGALMVLLQVCLRSCMGVVGSWASAGLLAGVGTTAGGQAKHEGSDSMRCEWVGASSGLEYFLLVADNKLGTWFKETTISIQLYRQFVECNPNHPFSHRLLE